METITTHHAQVTHLLKEHFGDREIVGIELGTNAADLTKTILRELPNLRLYTVDPWCYQEGNLFEGGHPQEEHDDIKSRAYAVLEEFSSRVSIMPKTSDEAFAQIDEKVDFVHIDGDHMIDAVRRDISNGLKIIKKGGIISGHDYPTVKEAIDDNFKDEEVNKGADMTWWVIL